MRCKPRFLHALKSQLDLELAFIERTLYCRHRPLYCPVFAEKDVDLPQPGLFFHEPEKIDTFKTDTLGMFTFNLMFTPVFSEEDEDVRHVAGTHSMFFESHIPILLDAILLHMP